MALKSAASGLGFDVDVQIETDQKRCARFSRAAKQLRNFALAGGSYIDNDTIVAMHDAVYTYKDKDIHIPELRAMSARLREHKSGRVEWLMAEAAADQLEHCSKLYSGQEFWVDCTVQVPLAHDIEVKLTLP